MSEPSVIGELLPLFLLISELEEEAALSEEHAWLALHVDDGHFRKRAHRKLRKRLAAPTPHGQRRRPGPNVGHKGQARRVAACADENRVAYYTDTGLTAAKFQYVYGLVETALCSAQSSLAGRVISKTWTTHSQLYIVLTWLRHNEYYHLLAQRFGGTPATISRLIWFVIPKLYVALRNHIFWPDGEVPAPFAGCAGAIDCTTHLRWRVHPWSCEFYRGDVHAHFLTAQLCCALSGSLWDVQLGLGHNNDQAMFNATGTAEILDELQINLLADGGYTGVRLVTPTDPEWCTAAGWSKQHAAFRSVVEQNFALVHLFQVAGGIFRQSPELQELALLCVYALVFIKCRDSPLRPDVAAMQGN